MNSGSSHNLIDLEKIGVNMRIRALQHNSLTLSS